MSDNGQCLTDDTLTEYLEGRLDPAIKTVSEVHLLSCEFCRERLVFFMKLLQPEVTPEEGKALQLIEASWARKRAAIPVPEPKSVFGNKFVAFAAVAAVVVVSVVSVWMLRTAQTKPQTAPEVVELLLKQHRPFESRIAGEPHLPILRTRGVEDNGVVSYEVLAAEMARLSASSYEMGRFYLLQKDFGHAIPYLEMAARSSTDAAAVHNDLGVAYLESGDATQLMKAEQEFVRASQDDASFAPAVFNLALFYERTNATAQAQTQWRRYLELDAKTEWAEEARGRLQGLNH